MILEPLSTQHLDEMFLLWGDFETVKLTNWVHTPTREACAERLTRVVNHYSQQPDNFGPWVVKDPNFVGLTGADFRGEGTWELWYIFRRDSWGRGIGTRTAAEMLARMRASGRVKHVVATAVTTNPGSWKLLEKLGFARAETIPGGFTRNGQHLDLYSYKLGF